jgi:hypothetical protein
VLPDIVAAPVPWCNIPAIKAEVEVAAQLMLAIVLLEIVLAEVNALVMPYTPIVTALVVTALEFILFAVVVLPIILPDIVTVALPPAAIPFKPEAIVADPVTVIPPILLFWILTTAGDEDCVAMPDNIVAALKVLVMVIAPVPVEAPTVLPVIVPTLALPLFIRIPVSVPDVPDRLMLVIVLPCTDDGVVVPTYISIPLNVVATVPPIEKVPVPLADAYPMILFATVNPLPAVLFISIARWVLAVV